MERYSPEAQEGHPDLVLQVDLALPRENIIFVLLENIREIQHLKYYYLFSLLTTGPGIPRRPSGPGFPAGP